MKKIILITLAFILAACSSSSTPKTGLDREPQKWTYAQKAELRRNQRKWEDANISHYRYNFSRVCFFCSNDGNGYIIEIQDGDIISVTYTDGSAITGQNWYLTIDEVFSALKSESFGKGDTVTVGYDPTYGFPVGVYIDNKEVTDDEKTLHISKFEVLP